MGLHDHSASEPLLFGRYRLIRKTSEDALCLVYLAHDPQLEHNVAVRLLRVREEGDPQSQRRQLLREAQAIARLAHPNVTRVFDFGSFEPADEALLPGNDSGSLCRAFIVTEPIPDGETLQAWLEATRRSPSAIIDRFLAAGRGLAAAHEAGLLHRDFKPDSVLVCGAATRVGDFGLACVIEPTQTQSVECEAVTEAGLLPTIESTDADHNPRPSAMAGTPLYMAPEVHEGLRPDARADQYAYCVSLYHALSGRYPYPADTTAELAQQKQSEPTPMNARGVSRAIDAVVRRGLSVDPDDRYPSMTDLLDALVNALRGRSRMPWMLGTGIGTMAALGLLWPHGPAGPCDPASSEGRPVVGWVDSDHARLREAFRRHAGETWAERWQEVQAQLDGHATAWQRAKTAACSALASTDEEVRLEASDTLACLHRRDAQFGALVDVLRSGDETIIGTAARTVARLPDAARCRTEPMSLPVPDDPRTSTEVEEIRELQDRVLVAAMAAQYAEGLETADEALERAHALGFEPVVAEARVRRGQLLLAAGRYAEAEADLAAGASMAEKSGLDVVIVSAANDLVSLVGSHQHRPDGVEPWVRLAEAATHRLGNRPLDRARLLHNRAMVALANGRDAEAAPLLEDALYIRRTQPHPNALDISAELHSLGVIATRRGRLDEAERRLAEALSHDAEARRDDPAWSAPTRDALATLAREQGRFQEAARHHQAALDLRITYLGVDHPAVAASLHDLGLARFFLGDLQGARELFARTLRHHETARTPDHPRVAVALDNLGYVASLLGEHDEAVDLHRRALAITDRPGQESPQTATGHHGLALALLMRGDFEDAGFHLDHALQLQREFLRADDPATGATLALQGRLALRRGEPVLARKQLQLAIGLMQESPHHQRELDWARLDLLDANH